MGWGVGQVLLLGLFSFTLVIGILYLFFSLVLFLFVICTKIIDSSALHCLQMCPVRVPGSSPRAVNSIDSNILNIPGSHVLA